MIDFGKIGEAIGGLFSGNQQALPLDAGALTQMLADAGIDPALLDGLSAQEVIGLLQQHGIDPGMIDPAQLTELLQGSGVGGAVAGLAQSWLESRKG
jgi:hypothetical protein